MKKIFFAYCLIIILFACSANEQDDNCLTLNVQLKDKGTQFYDLFKKIELIPLELNDSSYIKQIESIEFINDTLFVFDRELKSLIIFDGISGKHINSIVKVGAGPGEYTHVYDAIIDFPNGEIKLLSPFGFINTYDFSGQFLKKDNLPIPPNSYIYLKDFDDSTYLVWGSVLPESDLGNIILLSKETNEIKNSFWKGRGLEANFAVLPFWKYKDKTYFSISITNKVYQITSKGYNLVYKWDFGEYNIDTYREAEVLNVTLKNRTEKMQRIIKDMLTSEKLYRFNSKFENNKYYYAQIAFKNDKNLSPHLFYNKETGNSHYFLKTTEGLSFITHYFSDDYILAELLLDHKEGLLKSNILSETDQIKLNMVKDEDNPIIVKLYFK